MSVGVGELLVVLVIALIVLGPKRLPESARALGSAFREFRDTSGEVRYDAQQYMWEDRLEHEGDRPRDEDRGEEIEARDNAEP